MILSFDRVLKFAKLLCYLGLVAVLVATVLVLNQFRKDLVGVQQATLAATAAVKDIQERVDYTSQDLNAILLHVDIIAGRAERASRAQEEYWRAIGPRTVQLLGHADQLLVTTNGDETKIANHLDDVLETVRTTTNSANDLISSQQIHDVLENVDVTSKNTAETAKHIENTTALLEKKVQLLTKPASLAKTILLDLGKAAVTVGEIFQVFF